MSAACICDLERDELFIRIVFVELRTEIYGVNSRIISLDKEECFTRNKRSYLLTISFSGVDRAT